MGGVELLVIELLQLFWMAFVAHDAGSIGHLFITVAVNGASQVLVVGHNLQYDISKEIFY